MRVDRGRCQGCGLCAEVCPVGAIFVDAVAHVDPTACLECGSCVGECPHGALTMVGAPSASRESGPSSTPARNQKETPPGGTALGAFRIPGFAAAAPLVGRRRGVGSMGPTRRRGGFGRPGGRGRGRGRGRRR